MAGQTSANPDATKMVAVVVPAYKEHFSADEEISLRHLEHFLEKYDKYLITPEGLEIKRAGFAVVGFGLEFFHNPITYSALLLSQEFYEAFASYKYILIYQTDALVFSDQLAEWCATGIDYVGAPWFKGEGVDFVEDAAVGNGGFSLRKVESFLKVTRAPGFSAELAKYHDAFVAAKPWRFRLLHLPRKVIRRLRLLGGTGKAILIKPERASPDPGERLNEDCFWSFRAVRYYPGFRTASVAEALGFAFEVNPRRCYELNNYRLPFGCHGWNKYDRQFWEPFLIR